MRKKIKNKKDYTKLKQQFGAHLQKIRIDKGLSLREVAQNCDLDDSNISKMEHGRFNVQISTIYELAKGLNLHPADLLKYEFE
ncbi:helix-turn-helix transcriptional regulator [Pseudoflavitalea sp. G-6-1-2]|uniref:helix-turn-helix domain-containing protein n=1 Tax=Pseudoflavitalea sp. G-6-1-2 TaxID=2728841 RepID=UPI00146A549E|nr:helix-turn-helix transcriptional regulator [Pseudoflavitalea sp. G-6-1-2]NML24052.1 helix-turn-helix transcriptional regulator [Pseudoflavitalea sp. G-6-1-2]